MSRDLMTKHFVTQQRTVSWVLRMALAACLPVTGACKDDSDGTSTASISESSGSGGAAGAVSAGKEGQAGQSVSGAGRGGSAAGASADTKPATKRAQDDRTFTYDEATGEFAALPGIEAARYWGALDGAGYKIEVPKTWNGILVMYAHGYAGTGAALTVNPPSIRQYLIEHGYA